MDLRSLLTGLAIASLSIAVWGHLPSRLIERALDRRIALGVVMGLGAIASMLVPLNVSQGVIIDLKASLVAAAAFVGGPVSGTVASVIALSYRLSLWGAGVWVGCGGILMASTIGALGHARVGSPKGFIKRMVCVAACVAVGTPMTFLLLPQGAGATIGQTVVPFILLSFSCTCLVALSLRFDEFNRHLVSRDAIYRGIIEALPDTITAKDRESRFLVANPAAAHLMSVGSTEELIGRTDRDFYPPDMADIFRAEEISVLDNRVFGPVDQEVDFPDGRRRWLSSMKTPMLDADGTVVGILTHNRDITDQKGLEAELLKTQVYLQEAMNNMADALVLYDGAGYIRFSNSTYRDMFPKTADLRVKGSHYSDIVRGAVLRGEQPPKDDVEAYVADQVRTLSYAGDRVIDLIDGRNIELRTRPLKEGDTLVVLSDITARKQVERDLMRRASQDPLTSLANRYAFDFQLNAAHQRAIDGKTQFAVMMLDLDRFKPVNDTFGHLVGDKLLVEVAQRLQGAVRDGTLVARLGGDEFAFLIVAEDVETAAARLANRLVKSLKQPFRTDDVDLVPGGSLGVAFFPRDATDPFELLRLADKALYTVKTRGGGAWVTSAAAGQMRDRAKNGPPAQSAA